MRTIIGILIILGGIALGLYLGVWVMFIGGIVTFVEAVKATPVDALGIACGVVKVMGAGLVGWGSAILCFVVGGALIK